VIYKDMQANVIVGNFRDSDSIISLSHEAIAVSTSCQINLEESRNASNAASGCGPKDKMVKSKSGSAPHLVKITGNCDYICDGSCMQFKSLNICSHALAAAHINDDVDGFIQWYRKKFRKSFAQFDSASFTWYAC